MVVPLFYHVLQHWSRHSWNKDGPIDIKPSGFSLNVCNTANAKPDLRPGQWYQKLFDMEEALGPRRCRDVVCNSLWFDVVVLPCSQLAKGNTWKRNININWNLIYHWVVDVGCPCAPLFCSKYMIQLDTNLSFTLPSSRAVGSGSI